MNRRHTVFSVELYEKERADLTLKGRMCSFCHGIDTYRKNGTFKRMIVDMDRNGIREVDVKMQRVICINCRHTKSIYPKGIRPYSIYSVLFISKIILNSYTKKGYIKQICETFNIGRSSIDRWRMEFRENKKNYLRILFRRKSFQELAKSKVKAVSFRIPSNKDYDTDINSLQAYVFDGNRCIIGNEKEEKNDCKNTIHKNKGMEKKNESREEWPKWDASG